MNNVTNEYAKDICKTGQGEETCRYLAMSVDGFECAKLTALRSMIDARAPGMHARGDNCEGVG